MAVRPGPMLETVPLVRGTMAHRLRRLLDFGAGGGGPFAAEEIGRRDAGRDREDGTQRTRFLFVLLFLLPLGITILRLLQHLFSSLAKPAQPVTRTLTS